MINRAGLEDMICNTQRTLDFYKGINANCTSCTRFVDGVCSEHGPVPDEFIQQGCENWNYDDVPF